MQIDQYLSCPVVRPAKAEDAEGIARVLLNSNSRLFDAVYKDVHEQATELLIEQFRKYNQGVHVLQEGAEIIGVMKIHIPGVKMGKTISVISLIKKLGLLKAIRAALLLSNWDEYKLSPGEAYIEFLEVRNDWKRYGCEATLIERAKSLAKETNATYLTKFTCIRDYMSKTQLERMEFDMRKKIHSPIAKLYGETGTWRKYTFTLVDGPITVKEFVVDKIQIMKSKWQERRRESLAALKMSAIMSSIPIVGGILAYTRGYPYASFAWGILLIFHLTGGILILRDFYVGKYIIGIAMISESINLLARAINTTVWMDRGWLLPVAMINIWVLITLLKSPSDQDINQIEDSVMIQYADIIQKAKYH